MTRVAVLISGRGSNMAALIYAAKRPDCPFQVALVASDKPDAPGLALARAEGVTVPGLPPLAEAGKGAFYDALDAALGDAGVDHIALAGFMRILPAGFVQRWEGRILNIHPSLLPKYKGLNTHAAALEAGDTHGGCSVHIVTPELDDGPVLARTEVAILPGDTPERLAERVLIAEHQLYPHALAEYVSRGRDPRWLVGKVADIAARLPMVERTTSHGAHGWRVGTGKSGKFFAYVSIRHHGEDAIALLVKTGGPDEMAALIERDPDLYYRPAYYGASGWIAIRLDTGRTDWDHVAEWLTRSWSEVAPKRLREALGG